MHRGSTSVFVVSFACAASPAEHPETTTTTASSGTSEDTSSSSDGVTTTGTSGEPLACNGHAALCSRRVDEVTFASTHNSMAATDAGFNTVNANQHFGLRRQLDDGIRGMLLDVYEADGVLELCHGTCALGSLSHLEALGVLGDFLSERPHEVVIVIYEDHASSTAIASDWEASGFDALLYTHAGGTWPTLGELIADDTRVIVTAENGGPPPPWFHHVWDLAWDTPYSFHAIDELSCELNRGSTDNDLFLVNHWLSTELDLPDASAAPNVNVAAVLQPRVDACSARWGHPVNLLAVDFYDEGDLFAVVDEANGV